MNYQNEPNQFNSAQSLTGAGRALSADSPKEIEQANDRVLREIELLEESLGVLCQRLEPIILQRPEPTTGSCKEPQEYGCKMAAQLGGHSRRLSSFRNTIQRLLSEIQL